MGNTAAANTLWAKYKNTYYLVEMKHKNTDTDIERWVIRCEGVSPGADAAR